MDCLARAAVSAQLWVIRMMLVRRVIVEARVRVTCGRDGQVSKDKVELLYVVNDKQVETTRWSSQGFLR